MKKWELLSLFLVAILILTPLSVIPLNDFIRDRWCLTTPDQHQNNSSSFLDDLTLILSVATLGVLIFQSKIYLRQADIMKRQADISEQGMTIARQPQVYVKDVKLRVWDRTDLRTPFSANIDLVVIGETPASFRFLSEALILWQNLPVTRADFRGSHDLRLLQGGESLQRNASFEPPSWALDIVKQSGTIG